ncbi:MAG: YHS domain-containing protein [Nitrospiraceae bacterium]|nr:YHS domain-containing protein [Nitrospiraceae bacterium]
MYRLLLIAGLLTVLYFLLRRAIRELRGAGKNIEPSAGGGDGKQMVQDPVCRVFVPRAEAVREEVGGQTYFFCSRNCAKAFQKQLSD